MSDSLKLTGYPLKRCYHLPESRVDSDSSNLKESLERILTIKPLSWIKENKSQILSDVYKVLTKNHDLNGSIEEVINLPFFHRNTVFSMVSEALTEKGHLDEALSVASRIDYGTEDCKLDALCGVSPDTLSAISKAWVERDDLDKALEIAELAGGFKNDVLFAISKTLAENSNLKQALSVAGLISITYEFARKFDALFAISEVLSRTSDLSEALKAAEVINEKQHKPQELPATSKALTEKDYLDEALEELVNYANNEESAIDAFCIISKALVINGDLEKAEQVAGLTMNLKGESSGLSTMFKALAERVVTSAFSSISMEWVQRGNFEKAKQVAELIPDSIAAAIAWNTISRAYNKHCSESSNSIIFYP